jgi:hypothetical protein
LKKEFRDSIVEFPNETQNTVISTTQEGESPEDGSDLQLIQDLNTLSVSNKPIPNQRGLTTEMRTTNNS